MREEIVLVDSCQGFWSCIDPNTVIISLITLLGVFASSLLTYFLTKRQHKIDVFVNHKEFYSAIDGLDNWIPQLTDRIQKISDFESLSNLNVFKNETETLEFVSKEVLDGIRFDDAPYTLQKPLLKLMRLTLQVRGYTYKLIENLEAGVKEPINLTEVEKRYRNINKEIKKNHKLIKKYLL